MIMIPFPEKGDSVMENGMLIGSVMRNEASGDPFYDEERKTWLIVVDQDGENVGFGIEVKWRYDKTAWEKV